VSPGGGHAASPELLWVEELSEASLPRAGSKMARLGDLRRHGVKVPDGFVVSTAVFERFLASSSAGRTVETCMSRLEAGSDSETIASMSHAVRSAIESEPIPADIAEAIVDAYEELSYRRRDLNCPVAVRSSATGEDAKDASFAGLFDTLLGVTGPQRVLAAVRQCWASLFTERAVAYRATKGLDYRLSPMAVGILELVHARASGVAFSIHPVSGSTHRMVIEGSWGWGEAVVQGLVQPDHIEIGKSDRRVLDYRVADKRVVSCFDYARGLVVEQDMPKRLRAERILDGEQIAAVVDTVLVIEACCGYAVDTEWVLDRHRRPGEPITIVQTRPVTVKPLEDQGALQWDPVAYATKYAFGGKNGG
jgi:pyruvate,water dikinase